jgi:hypothetical protein
VELLEDVDEKCGRMRYTIGIIILFITGMLGADIIFTALELGVFYAVIDSINDNPHDGLI